MNEIAGDLFKVCLNSALDFCFCMAIILLIITMFRIKSPQLKYFLFLIPFIKLWYDTFTLFFNGALSPVLQLQKHNLDLWLSVGLGSSGVKLWSLIFSCIIANRSYSLGDIILGIIGSRIASALVVLWVLTSIFLLTRRYIAYFQYLKTMESNIEECRELNIFISPEVTSPMVTGVIAPKVIIPASLYSTLTPRELQLVIEHERNHIRRHDNLINHLISITRDIFFFVLPLPYLIKSIALEREKICDKMAIGEKAEKALDLARAMLKVAEMKIQGSNVRLSNNIPIMSLHSMKQSELTLRVNEMLTEGREKRGILKNSFAYLIIFLIVLKILIGTSFFTTSGVAATVTTIAFNIIVTA